MPVQQLNLSPLYEQLDALFTQTLDPKLSEYRKTTAQKLLLQIKANFQQIEELLDPDTFPLVLDALLPSEELQQYIFSFIDEPEDLANLALVDRKRHRLITDPVFLRNKIKKLAGNTWIMQLASLNDNRTELRCLWLFTLKLEEMLNDLKTSFMEAVFLFTTRNSLENSVHITQEDVLSAIKILSTLSLIADQLPTGLIKAGNIEGTLPVLAKRFASYLLNSILIVPELALSPDRIPESIYRLADQEAPAAVVVETPATRNSLLRDLALSRFKLFDMPQDRNQTASQHTESETNAAQQEEAPAAACAGA